jgi:hypothetical protein
MHANGYNYDHFYTENYFHTNDDPIAYNATEGYCGPIRRMVAAHNHIDNSATMGRTYNLGGEACGTSGVTPLIDDIDIGDQSGTYYLQLYWLGVALGSPYSLSLNPGVTNWRYHNSEVSGPLGFAISENDNITLSDFDWTLASVTGGYGQNPQWFVGNENAITGFNANFRNVSRTFNSGSTNNYSAAWLFAESDGNVRITAPNMTFNGYKDVSVPAGRYGPIPCLVNNLGYETSAITTLTLSGLDYSNLTTANCSPTSVTHVRGVTHYSEQTAVLFGSLPAAASTNLGDLWSVSDSSTAVWGATITGSGSNKVVAYSNGTNWVVAGL